jgi:hypothetical protein
MIKVRIVRGVGAAVTGASGLLLLGGSEACSAPVATDGAGGRGDPASTSTGVTLDDAGTGTLALDYAYGETPGGLAFLATGSVDELVRVGERLTATVPAYFIWSFTHPDEVAPDDVARGRQLTATITVSFLRAGQVTGATTLGIASWSGAELYALRGETGAFTVPARTDALTFDIVFGDLADPGRTAHLPAEIMAPVYVFGGELPLKHALFDTEGPRLRTRIVEGGRASAGADVVVTYTDWRANTVIDSYSLDRQIGTAQAFGRFGSFEMPIYGELAYEVSYGYAFDGAWQAEAALPEVSSRLLLSPRTAFESTLHAEEGARALSAYFHVKVFLAVDYARYGNVTSRRYAQGDRVLLRERYDNADGVAFRNYELALEPQAGR